MRKLFTLLLAVAASVGTMFASTQIDGIWYLFSSNKATVTYQGSTYSSYPDEYSGDIVIPASVTHNNVTYSVTSIGNEAFHNCATLTSVTIPNSVTSIGEEAFYGCSGLTSITIPNSVKIIGDYAFSGCSNASITIPNTVTNIGDNAFGSVPNIIYYGSLLGSPWGAKCINGFVDGYFVYTSALKTTLIACCTSVQGDIVIPNSVTRIGSSAFSGCSGLTSVTIPNSVTSIGSSAFRGCSGLTSVTIPNSVTSIGDEAFRSCSGLTSPIYNVHVFAYMPTSYSGAYTIPDGIESIAGNAFAGCSSLTSVTIPNSVTSIGYRAFSGCSGLTSVTIPNSVTSIGSNVFQVCTGLTSITISNSVTSIGSNVFQGCSGLTSVTIPNSVTSIGSSAFSGCSGLTSITIPNSVTSIGKNAFSGCSNINTIFYEGSIENWCTKKWSSQIIAPTYSLYLNGEEAQNVILPNTISSIPMNVFEGCINLTSVTIPNSVTSIGDYAFSGCSSLNSVSLPDSLFSIGRYAFSECVNLLEIRIPHTIETIGSNAFDCVTRVVSNNENYRTYIRATPQGNLSGKGYLLVQASVNASYQEDNELPDEFGVWGYKFGRDGSHITISFPCNNTFKAGDVINIYTTKNSDIGNSMYLYSDSQGQELLAIIPHNENAGLHSITLGEEVEGLNTISLYRKKNSTYDMNPYVAYMEVVRTKSFHYNVECNNEEGAVSSSGVAEYMENLEISAMPNDHYHFTQWSDGNTDNPRTITLTQDTTITAEFEKNTYTISTVSSNPEWGSTSGDTSAFYLDTVIIVATPNTGYQFTQWSDGNTNNPRTIVLIQDTMYAAEFANSTCLIASGTCGDNLTWELGCDSVLTISGTGAMTEWQSIRDVPWYDYHYSIVKSLVLNEGVTTIGGYAFDNCPLITSINIPNTVTSIGEWAFESCHGLTSVTIPESVASIGLGAFNDCTGLTSPVYNTHIFAYMPTSYSGSYTIPVGIESIAGKAFEDCTGLTSISIPNSVTTIRDCAFQGCTGLTSITCEAVTPPSLGSSAFENVDKSKCTLYVPLESIGAYQAADQWKEFLDILPLPGTEGTTGEDCSNAIPFDWEQGTVNPKGQHTWYVAALDTAKLYAEGKSLRLFITNDSKDNASIVSFSLFFKCGDPAQGDIKNKSIPAGDTLRKDISLDYIKMTNSNSIFLEFQSSETAHIWMEKIDYKRDTLYGDTTIFVCKGATVMGCTIMRDTVWNDTVSNIKDEEHFRIINSIYTVNVFVLREPQAYDFSDKLQDIKRGEVLDLSAADAWLKAQYGAADNDTIQDVVSIKWQYAIYPDNMNFIDIDLAHQPTVASERIIIRYFALTECYEEGSQLDPTVIANMSFLNTARDTIRVEACNSYRWAANDSLYTVSTFDSVKVSDGRGVWGDSIVYLNLRINHCGIPVIFLDDNDHVLSEQNVDLHLPAAPIISGKSFKGWLTESADSQNGIVFRATYTTDNPTTYDDVNITPYSNSAAVIFPFITGALSYQLVIRDLLGNVVCKIMFSASGHLMGVVFAPSRNRAQQHATETTGFNFTVEGLDANTTYEYEFVANDDTDEVIETLSGSFTTTAEVPTDKEQVNSPSAVRKYLEDGHLMIDANSHTFDTQGKMMK